MEFMDVVEARYSYKQKFLDTPVPWEHLEEIAKAGLMAANAMNAQCVHLVILENKKAIEPLLDIAARDRLESVPAAIAVFTDNSNQQDFKNFEMEDYSAATENMLLAATNLGYASVWLDGPYFDEKAERAVSKVLKVPETFHLRVILPIGHPAEEEIRRPKKAFWERVSVNVFGEKK